MSTPVQGVTTITHADAAISRGSATGGGGGGQATQAGQKAAQLLQGWLAPLLFIGTAIGIGAAAVQRNAGLAVVTIVLALVIGAFVLVPNQMETMFRSIYQFVL